MTKKVKTNSSIQEYDKIVEEKWKNKSLAAQAKNKELVEELSIKERIACPFPEHEGYAKVWKNLKPEEQRQMKENFRISSDGKVESIKLHKKFSILDVITNRKGIIGKGIIDEHYKDIDWKSPIDKGISWVKYFTNEAAARECKKQGKMFLKNGIELKQLIDSSPGKRIVAKLNNLSKLLELKKFGCLTISNVWYWDNDFVEVALSEVNGTYNTIIISNLDKYISAKDPEDHGVFIACEDC